MGLTEMWDQSNGVENRDLPDGTYNARVIECKNGTTKAGQDKIEWVLEIADGVDEGRKCWIHRVLDPNKQFTIDLAKTDFLNLKVDCSGKSLKRTMADLTGRTVILKLHPNKTGDSQLRDIMGFADIKAATVTVDDAGSFGKEVFPGEEIPF
jgi:hypothetical protein